MAAVNLKSLKSTEIENILRDVDTIISDCDGVLWLHTTPLNGVPQTVKWLKEVGKRIFYITNSPRNTRQELVEQLRVLGYEAKPEEVIGVAYLVARYLKSLNFNKKVYLIGCSGIGGELDAVGIPYTGVGPDIMTPDLKTVVNSFVPAKDIGAVVIGFDEHISYPKLMRAASYLSDPNVHFIATSMDIQVPIPNGCLPGPGALVKCVEACSGRKALVLGKPEHYIRQTIIDSLHVVPERTLFVGDSAQSDVLLGKRCGMKTLLVLSGVTTEEDINLWKKSTTPETRELIPDFYTDSLADLHL